jgi:hypothetical protein
LNFFVNRRQSRLIRKLPGRVCPIIRIFNGPSGAAPVLPTTSRLMSVGELYISHHSPYGAGPT